MIITAIRIRKLEETGTKLIGTADITLDDLIVLHDIKLLMNNGTFFLAMPSKKTYSGFRDIFHPICAEPREKLEGILKELYDVAAGRESKLLDFKNRCSEKRTMLEQCSNDFEICYI